MGFINLTYKVVVKINEIIQKKPSMLYLGKCKFSMNSQCGGHPIFRLLISYSQELNLSPPHYDINSVQKSRVSEELLYYYKPSPISLLPLGSFLEHFQHPEQKLSTHPAVTIPHSTLQPQATTNLLFASMDFLILDMWLLCLAVGGIVHFTSPLPINQCSNFSIFLPILVTLCLLILAALVGVMWYLMVFSFFTHFLKW